MATTDEQATYFQVPAVDGVEALHARFVGHAYPPHSHPTWTVAVMRAGAAEFDVDSTHHRAGRGELFILEPDAVHTGMAAVPQGWRYEVLYLDSRVLHAWEESDGAGPRAARWTVFRDDPLQRMLLLAHRAIAEEPDDALAAEGVVLQAIDRLRPHLRAVSEKQRGSRPEHAAVRRAAAMLTERWNESLTLSDLAAAAGLSRFELVRQFHAQKGLTPHSYRTNLRVEHARRMLAGGEKPAVVAAVCGFADQAHLTRTFRRLVGVTPGRYARAVAS